MKKQTRPKTVAYELIDHASDLGRPMYARLYSLVDQHHEDLSRSDVRIALAWCTSWKPDADGIAPLGKCKKASDLDRELAPYDFVILISKDWWTDTRISDQQRDALLDHELMHGAVVYDQHGEMKRDERGRYVFRIRRHDLEEFEAIVGRYGCWKRDIESFAKALGRADRAQATLGWVSYTKVSETLAAVGVTLDAKVIAEWTESERSAVYGWALLRKEAGAVANLASGTMPDVLMAAVVQARVDATVTVSVESGQA